MYNWSVDEKKLSKYPQKYAIWKLEQLINFGINDQKLKASELKKYFDKLVIDPQKRKYLKFLLSQVTTSILSPTQKLFLTLFGKEIFSQKFYLSGGTALAEFYIPYRYSEDLDFFSTKEIQIDEILAFIRKIKGKLGFGSFDFNTSFNRNLIFVHFKNETLKLEFTYYPFQQISDLKEKFGIKIDSIEDIAVNKLFTIYQNPRSRDFMDLYMIMKKYNFSIKDLVKKAKVKFDWRVDPIKLGSQLLLAKELKDYPQLKISLDEKKWQKFFIDEAKILGEDIIEKT